MKFKRLVETLKEEKGYGIDPDYSAVDYAVSQDAGDDYSLEYLEEFDSYEDALKYALNLAKEYRREGSENVENINILCYS